MMLQESSFTARRVNSTTFVIVEDDKYGETPYIYAKLHLHAPLVILNDTGCDAPAEKYGDDSTKLRQFIETVPLNENGNRPLNPGGHRTYLVIVSHCHYDHIGGVEQFAENGRVPIIASAAGRDFIESDLPAHSICKHMKIDTPRYEVTYWAQSNQRLTWPLPRKMPGDDALIADETKRIDLGIMTIHTPGHTPDSLAWYDIAEHTLCVGDSFYRLGTEKEPIIFPTQGDLVEWIHSMNKLEALVQSHDNSTTDIEDEWVSVKPDMKICCSHTTVNAPAKRILHQVSLLVDEVISKYKKPTLTQERFNETFDYYLGDVKDGDVDGAMSLLLPRRLVDDARRWFSVLP